MCDKLACKKSWLYDRAKNDPSFPRPLRLGTVPRYIEAELDAWMVANTRRHEAACAPRLPGRPRGGGAGVSTQPER